METNETVWVQRRPGKTWQTAEYRFQDVEGWHLRVISGGRQTMHKHPEAYGYVMCDAMLQGELGHSCKHGPGPHRILVCISRGDARMTRKVRALAKASGRLEWMYR